MTKNGIYTNGKIKVAREDQHRDKVTMGDRTLGYIDRRTKTFKCWRTRNKCEADSCKDCRHKCHYFRLYSGYGVNLELLVAHKEIGFDNITIILSDFTGPTRVQRLLYLPNRHWVFSSSAQELGKRAVQQQNFEPQVVVPENDFEELE